MTRGDHGLRTAAEQREQDRETEDHRPLAWVSARRSCHVAAAWSTVAPGIDASSSANAALQQCSASESETRAQVSFAPICRRRCARRSQNSTGRFERGHGRVSAIPAALAAMSAYPLGKMVGVVGGGQLGRMMVRAARLPPARLPPRRPPAGAGGVVARLSALLSNALCRSQLPAD